MDFQDGLPIGTILVMFDLKVNWPRGVGGVGNRLLKQIVAPHDGRRTTDPGRRTADIDRSQWLTLSTSCSGELKSVFYLFLPYDDCIGYKKTVSNSVIL